MHELAEGLARSIDPVGQVDLAGRVEERHTAGLVQIEGQGILSGQIVRLPGSGLRRPGTRDSTASIIPVHLQDSSCAYVRMLRVGN
jgi:hypothetical protein